MSDTIFPADITNWHVYNFCNANETCTFMYSPSNCLICAPVIAFIDIYRWIYHKYSPQLVSKYMASSHICKGCAGNTDNRVCNTGNQFLRMKIFTGRLFRATARHKQFCKLYMMVVLTTNHTATAIRK
jgi:hypothetical protein